METIGRVEGLGFSPTKRSRISFELVQQLLSLETRVTWF